MGISLALHTVFAAGLGFYTWSLVPPRSGVEQAMRVNLILAPEADGAGANAGQSGSHPASAAPAARPAPVPRPSLPEAPLLPAQPFHGPPPAAEEAVATQEALPTPTQIHGAPPPSTAQTAAAPARTEQTHSPPGTPAKDAPAPPAQRAATVSAIAGDSELIPAAWNMGEGAALGGMAVFQARFREPPAAPGYPPESLARNEEGTVWLDLYLSETGAVQELRVARSSGYPRLDRAAATAVQRWRFLPSRRFGTAVASWVRVPVHFQLR
jgi:protein TonB